VASILCKPGGQAFVLIAALSVSFRALRAAQTLPRLGAFNASAIRITAHALRGGGVADLRGLRLELLRDGCPVAGRRAGGKVAGSTYTAMYDGVREANGLAFAAGGAGGGADLAEWTAEALYEGRWAAVAASGMLLWPQVPQRSGRDAAMSEISDGALGTMTCAEFYFERGTHEGVSGRDCSFCHFSQACAYSKLKRDGRAL
jgi:hypothetical protein